MKLPITRSRIFILPIIIYLIGVIIFSILNYQNERKKMIAEIDHQLLQAAKTLKFILPRNFHDRALSKNSISPIEDLKNREVITNLASEYGVSYIYSFVKRGNQIFFTSSSANEEDIAAGNISPYWDEYQEATPLLHKTFISETPSFETASDRWGTFRSVLMPEYSVSGQKYVVGVDHDISYVEEQLFYRMLEVFLKLGFLLLLLLPFCIAFISSSRSFSKDLMEQVKLRTRELEEETLQRKVSEEKRKKLEDRLQLSQKLESLGTLAAGIAHEINTPIQFIHDNLSFLSDECKNVLFSFRRHLSLIEKESELEEIRKKSKNDAIVQDLDFLQEEIPKALNEASEGAQRVSKIVRSIRIFSHVNENQGVKVEVDLNKSLEPALFLTQNEWKSIANVRLTTNSDIPKVKCYITEINQVVMNLIINAVHSIEEKQKKNDSTAIGHVDITLKKEDGFVVIQVEDDGLGIPKHVQEKVYDPFFTTKEVGKGTGQGLSLAYKTIVEAHNGELYFETEQNKGTKFYIKIPTIK